MAIIQTGEIFKALRFDGTSAGQGGVLSSDYGVYITGEAVYNAPKRRVNMLQIPGRNGLFAQDDGAFDNITITYPAGLIQGTETDFKQAISNFRNALCSRVGYHRLEDDYNTDEYRMAVYKEGLEVSPADVKAGEFSITFECKPQRWLKTGDSWQTLSQYQSLSNPTLFDASPLFEVQGYGSFTIQQGDITTKTIEISEASGVPTNLYIDCETGWSYYSEPGGYTSASDRVTLPLDLPRFTANGLTRIQTIDSTITRLAVKPRWWKI